MKEQTPEAKAWHASNLDDVWKAVDSNGDGLTQDQASARLKTFGPNSLPHEPPPTWWQILLRQFQSPLIYILLAAAIVSVIAQDYKDAGFIALVLAINALIGGYQEWRAEQSSQALQKLLHIRSVVSRDGETREVDAEELVPGDLVWLESGNRVPADLRLISTQGLEIDESLLTGESLAVSKDADWAAIESAPVADRLNLAYAASIIVRGRAKGVVVSTGSATVVGQLAVDVINVSGGRPPLLERMEKFSNTIAYLVLASVAFVSVLGIVIHGHTLQEMFLFGVALAVSAIPEGLPAALTVALAIATSRMARRGVIVRRLAAVEGLGSCTMIASDKTGTLTCNELTVRDVRLPDGSDLPVRGEGYLPEGEILLRDQPVGAGQNTSLADLVRVGVLCNEAELFQKSGGWKWRGDPTDIALLSLGIKAGMHRKSLIEQYPLVAEIPFEPEYQYAATFHRVEDAVRVFVKGAPERVLGMCEELQGSSVEQLLAMAEDMAAQGFRVLGMADGPAPEEPAGGRKPAQPAGLQFRGFVGMIDPLRPGVRDAVLSCRDAGITVCMITGDHPVTALAICRELGLADSPDQVVTGAELSGKSPDEIRTAIRRGRVFARVAPRQKLELVEAAQAEGHFVAVTGDGVNDAPALRAANIGVAMGKSGTDVAREASDLVISDDNFTSIVAGVEEGRVAYDNVRKVIYLLISTGAAEVLLIAAAFAVGAFLPLPFLPVQLLWLNLVTNGIQGIALAFEPAEDGILKRRPRRPGEAVFDRLMIERTIVAGGTMAVVGVIAFWWMISSGWAVESARNGLLLLMVLFENVHIGNCRSESRSAFSLSPLRSPFLLAGAVSAFLIHLLALYVPFLQSMLRTEPVSLTTWLVMIGLSMSVLAAIEIHKWTWRKRGYAD